MPYYLQGVIAPASTLQKTGLPDRYLIDLPQAMRLIPFTPALQRKLTIPRYNFHVSDLPDDLESCESELRPETARACMRFSESGDLLYVEANIHGGYGNQLSVLFRNGKQAGPFLIDTWAINKGLKQLGVSAPYTKSWDDEFEAINLDRHRSTEGWVSHKWRKRN